MVAYSDLRVCAAPVGDAVEDVGQVEEGEEEEERVGPDAEEGDGDEAGRRAVPRGDQVGSDGRDAR